MARFTLPRDLYHGKGSLENLKNLKGKKAVIVVGGGSMKRNGFLQRAEDYLKQAGMEVMLIEGVELEFAVGHRLVGSVGPHIAHVNENGTVKDIIDRETVFGIELQLQVARLFNVICDGHITTWTNGAVEPSTQSVGAAAIEATLEG